MQRLILTIMLFLSSYSLALAESSVWVAQKDGTTIYLGGTFHLLREADYPLPPEFDKAYRRSDIVVLETEVGKFNDPSYQQKLLTKGMYDNGITIDQKLSPRVYARLKDFCEVNSIPLEALRRLKPSLLMMTVVVMELSSMGVSTQGVDQFFYAAAKKDGKAIETLETFDEQIELIGSLADGNEDEFVVHSLKDMENLRSKFESFIRVWRSGDAAGLDRLYIDGMRTSQPLVYKRMITDRNSTWLRTIESYKKLPKTRFVLVGAGHLVGADGILEALKKRGYTVSKL